MTVKKLGLLGFTFQCLTRYTHLKIQHIFNHISGFRLLNKCFSSPTGLTSSALQFTFCLDRSHRNSPYLFFSPSEKPNIVLLAEGNRSEKSLLTEAACSPANCTFGGWVWASCWRRSNLGGASLCLLSYGIHTWCTGTL